MKWTITKPEPVRPIAIRFDLPFCIHLQNGAYEVKIEKDRFEVELQKVWRNSENCSTDDSIYDRQIRFETGTVRSGPIGSDAEAARTRIGTNVEIGEDARGEFRFTRATVGLVVPADLDPDLEKVLEEALRVVNRIVDVFRFVSKRAYIPPVAVNDITFVEVVWPLTGASEYHGLYGKGLEIAIVNETRSVHERVRVLLGSGEEIPLHSEMFLSARRLLGERSFRQSVVEAISALQVLVEQVLRVGRERGQISNGEAETLRQDRLSDLMKNPFRKILGWSPADSQELWSAWLKANELRRAIVHQGARPEESETTRSLEAVEALANETESKLASIRK